MAEITSEVYDIFHPTPVPLKQLSAIAVSLGIWRCKMHLYRTNCRLHERCVSIGRNLLNYMLPELPSAIFDVIHEYVEKLQYSLNHWLDIHYSKVFYIHGRYKTEIVLYFDGFVCDHDGVIQHTKTAERLMHCSALKESEKFIIACTYSFEDHIRRIWPNVRRMVHFNADARFDWNPQMKYWICYLKNELNKISIPRTLSSVDELMFDENFPHNRPSMEYFWFRMPLQTQLQRAFKLFDRDVNAFVKFILQKLNDQQLDEFVESKGLKLLIVLSTTTHNHNEELFLPTWKYIKSRMSYSMLTNLASKILNCKAGSSKRYTKSFVKLWWFICSEIWDSIDLDLKLSIVENILSRPELFKTQKMKNQLHVRYPARHVEYLLTFLSCATFVQKKPFWRKCWRRLIKGARVEDLQQIVKLCFENERMVTRYKKKSMAGTRSVRHRCVPLLLKARFDELNALVDFCNPDRETARIYKQELLRSSLLGQSTSLSPDIVKNPNGFRIFVDDVFNNADQSTDFKNQLMSSRKNQIKLKIYLSYSSVPFEALMEFIDQFVLAEQTTLQIKERMNEYLMKLASDPEFAGRRDVLSKKPSLDQFLLWCLGSDEEVATFKELIL